jgi:hypothetical protein
MEWNRFDIVEAHYAFAVDYHEGQRSALYARQCRISQYFTPGATWQGYDSLSENGREIYEQLATEQDR